MRFTRARILLAGTLAAAGTAATVIVAVAPASAGPASAAATQVVLVNACTGHGQVKPRSYEPGCMPANSFIDGMKWTSWRSVAFGTATFKVNNCTPSSSCGPSKFTKYPILTVLWRSEPWPGHPGQKYFSRLTVVFDGKAHPHGPAAQTLRLPAAP
jgi:hypothetical protein